MICLRLWATEAKTARVRVGVKNEGKDMESAIEMKEEVKEEEEEEEEESSDNYSYYCDNPWLSGFENDKREEEEEEEDAELLGEAAKVKEVGEEERESREKDGEGKKKKKKSGEEGEEEEEEDDDEEELTGENVYTANPLELDEALEGIRSASRRCRRRSRRHSSSARFDGSSGDDDDENDDYRSSESPSGGIGVGPGAGNVYVEHDMEILTLLIQDQLQSTYISQLSVIEGPVPWLNFSVPMSLYMGTLQIVQNFKRELEGFDEEEMTTTSTSKSPAGISATPVVDAKPRSLNLEKVRKCI